jgi:hypothetical protein
MPTRRNIRYLIATAPRARPAALLRWPERIPERPGNGHIRHTLNGVVIIPHRAVVEAACVLQVILDLDEIALQLKEGFVCFEVGISLLQDHDTGERFLELGFDLAKSQRALE